MRTRHLTRSIWRRNWNPRISKHLKVHPTPVIVARRTILDSLTPLFNRARKEKLWFWNRSTNVWFSPSQLVVEWKRHRYIWGPDHWTLRDPEEFHR